MVSREDRIAGILALLGGAFSELIKARDDYTDSEWASLVIEESLTGLNMMQAQLHASFKPRGVTVDDYLKLLRGE
jgi:hypothetical protein